MEGTPDLERVPMNLPAQGAWNDHKGVVGTGEALLGPVLRWTGASLPITENREMAGSREGVGGGRSSDDGRGQHNPARAKGPYFT